MCVEDTFAAELVSVETMGPVTRLVFTTLYRCEIETEKRVVARIVVPTEIIARMARQLVAPAFVLDTARQKVAGGEEAPVHH
jgi:hypothetical protein